MWPFCGHMFPPGDVFGFRLHALNKIILLSWTKSLVDIVFHIWCDFSIRKQRHRNSTVRSRQPWKAGWGEGTELSTAVAPGPGVPVSFLCRHLAVSVPEFVSYFSLLFYLKKKKDQKLACCSLTGKAHLVEDSRAVLSGRAVFSSSLLLWNCLLVGRKGQSFTLRLLSAILKLQRANHFMVNGVGNNEFSHPGCQICPRK